MNKNKLFSVLVPLVSVLLAFLIGCIIMFAAVVISNLPEKNSGEPAAAE